MPRVIKTEIIITVEDESCRKFDYKLDINGFKLFTKRSDQTEWYFVREIPAENRHMLSRSLTMFIQMLGNYFDPSGGNEQSCSSCPSLLNSDL